MRIKAITKNDTSVKNLPSGGSTIATIPKDTFITVTKLTKIGILTYYFIEEYNGYVKKENLRLVRDEEFYYTSSLLRSKANRSIMPMTATYAVQPRDAVIHDTTNQSGAAVKTKVSKDNSGVIKGDPKSASEEAKAGAGNNYTRAIASTAANLLGSNSGGTRLASTMLSSFANTGNWDEANNMELGNFFGGITGDLLNGATISNISDGSFFTNQLRQNVAKLAVSYLNTLMMKLNYVVGFNLTGALLNLLSGFGVLDRAPIGIEVGWDGNFRITLPNVSNIEERIRKAYPSKKPAESIRAMAADIGAGDMTVKDIVDELKKPARDPREDAPPVVFRNDVRSFDDLEEGMELTGTVRNVVDFGAFVDIGVKNDGLVHVSQLSHKYVKHPMDVVAVGDTVKVKILGIDRDKQKVSLTMKL